MRKQPPDRATDPSVPFRPSDRSVRSRPYSLLSACTTSIRDARAAGINDAMTAADDEHERGARRGHEAGQVHIRHVSAHEPRQREPAEHARDDPEGGDHSALASTRASRCRGSEPTASRMPNSRVRALTENASTPATPMTAMSSATPANTPNTSAFRRSGASTSARTSSSVAACSTG